MIVTALILAAAVTTAPAPAPEAMADMPNLYRQPERCGPLHAEVVRRQQAALKGKARGFQYAVMRKVDGCAVAAPAGYHPDYLAPGRADAPNYRRDSDIIGR